MNLSPILEYCICYWCLSGRFVCFWQRWTHRLWFQGGQLYLRSQLLCFDWDYQAHNHITLSIQEWRDYCPWRTTSFICFLIIDFFAPRNALQGSLLSLFDIIRLAGCVDWNWDRLSLFLIWPLRLYRSRFVRLVEDIDFHGFFSLWNLH